MRVVISAPGAAPARQARAETTDGSPHPCGPIVLNVPERVRGSSHRPMPPRTRQRSALLAVIRMASNPEQNRAPPAPPWGAKRSTIFRAPPAPTHLLLLSHSRGWRDTVD